MNNDTNDRAQAELMCVLDKALHIKRPANSEGEMEFVVWLAKRLPVTSIDMAGNLHVDLRTCFGGPGAHRTLFVAHTDTVCRSRGRSTRNVVIKDDLLWRTDGKDTLGADDGAGVALLCALIEANVPAYYIFTRGEECGGVGSRFLAENMPDLLVEFDRAIAVDRKDVFSVITHQMSGRCCSGTFGAALCEALNERGMLMEPDDTGVYTDTAEFMRLIPECTNISAGYYDEHTPDEFLDVDYLQRLLNAALTIQWDELPTERDPEDGDAEDVDLSGMLGWEAAYNRWEAEEKAAALENFDILDLQTDPFAWSDDGVTAQTGSGRHRVRALS